MQPPRSAGPAGSPDWDAPALATAMGRHLPGLQVEVVERIGSTNTALVERYRALSQSATDTPHSTLLVAEAQTQGKGRLGRAWLGHPGDSLTCSLALPLAAPDWSGLSLAVGVAVAQALDPQGQWLRLKWPNDLWRVSAGGPGRKLGGILIEALAVGEHRVAVIGVGLNVRRPADLPAELAVASLCEQDPRWSAASALAQVGPALAEALARFDRQGFAAFVEAYRARDLLAGHGVITNDPACPDGCADGVDADGALRVRRAGQLHRIVSGEVSVRPQGAGPLPAPAR